MVEFFFIVMVTLSSLLPLPNFTERNIPKKIYENIFCLAVDKQNASLLINKLQIALV